MRALPLPAIVLATVLALLTAAPGARAAATWDMASPYPEDDVRTRSAKALSAAVSAASEDGLTLVVFANGSLVAHPQIPKALENNEIPIAIFDLSRLAEESPVFAFSSLPMLAATYDDALRLWNAARPVMQRLFDERGLMPLYALPAVPSKLFSRAVVNTVDDLKRQPVASPDPWLRALAEAAGAPAVAAETGDLRQTFADGRAQAMLVPPSAAIQANAWTFSNEAYDVRASFPLAVVAVNQNAFYALDEASQRALLNAAVEAQNDAWSHSIDARNAEVNTLDAHKLIVQPSPPALQDGLRQAARSVIERWVAEGGADAGGILAAYGWPPVD